jgi:hypothetical protein
VLYLARVPGFHLRWVWYVSVATVLVQLTLAMWFLRHEFSRRLRWEPANA